MFYLSNIVYWQIHVVNDSVLNPKICAMPWLPTIQQLKLGTLRWCSFSGCGREHFAVVFVSTGSQYVINGCLQSIGIKISQDRKLKHVDSLMTLILRIQPRACRCSLTNWGLPTSEKWMSPTNRNINQQSCVPGVYTLSNLTKYPLIHYQVLGPQP